MIIQRDQFHALFGDGIPTGADTMTPSTYMSASERSVLLALARFTRAGTVIEFGTQSGATAHLLLDQCPHIKTYIGIDLPPGEHTALESQEKEIPPEPGALALPFAKRFRLLLQDSTSLQPTDLPKADLILIDGGHDYETVKSDSILAASRIRPGGVIIWHDYNPLPEIGVRTYIDQTNNLTGNHITLVASTWLCFRFANTL